MKDLITLAHGGGGKAMQALLEDVILPAFGKGLSDQLEDQARLPMSALAAGGDRLAFTTDTYVVEPLFFPGGDIGQLAINGTVNDLAVGGARPLYLSCGFVIEEGLEIEVLRRVISSMAQAAEIAKVSIVTGDTKVVPKGQCDKLYINTSGIGVIPDAVNIASNRAEVGDAIIVNGPIGNHGAAILSARQDLKLGSMIRSDTQSLAELVALMLSACSNIKSMRDATRGGVASVLNELAQASGCTFALNEGHLPIEAPVRGLCEILGFDPLYLANEGVLVAVVPSADAERTLEAMRTHPAGRASCIIGSVVPRQAASVVVRTSFGGQRILDRLVGEQLPRIC